MFRGSDQASVIDMTGTLSSDAFPPSNCETIYMYEYILSNVSSAMDLYPRGIRAFIRDAIKGYNNVGGYVKRYCDAMNQQKVTVSLRCSRDSRIEIEDHVLLSQYWDVARLQSEIMVGGDPGNFIIQESDTKAIKDPDTD